MTERTIIEQAAAEILDIACGSHEVIARKLFEAGLLRDPVKEAIADLVLSAMPSAPFVTVPDADGQKRFYFTPLELLRRLVGVGSGVSTTGDSK